jgi:hypothetical protein
VDFYGANFTVFILGTIEMIGISWIYGKFYMFFNKLSFEFHFGHMLLLGQDFLKCAEDYAISSVTLVAEDYAISSVPFVAEDHAISSVTFVAELIA